MLEKDSALDDYLISVLLPVYNGERYLRAAVNSIISQSFTRFELLMLDDGSTDRSLEIMRDYAAKDSRVVVITRENRGIVATLNELLDRSRGRYIARMDADDIAHPERFATQVRYLDSHPEIVLCGTNSVNIDERGLPMFPSRRPLDHEGIDAKLIEGCCSILHPSIMVRREAMVGVGGYRQEYRDAEDLDLFLRMAEVGRLANLPEFLLEYRVHDGSVSTERHLGQLELARRAAVDACRRRGLPQEVAVIRATGDRAPDRIRFNFLLGRAWRAWNNGYRETWRWYAVRAVRHRPWSVAAWKVLVIGAVRKSPETSV